MLKAYEIFRKASGKDCRMVIIGEKMFMTSEIDRTIKEMKYGDEVIFTGRLNPGLLHNILASAEAMIFVPFFEGFGIPMVEAMKCGIPVIASDATSLPEVSGGAALHCDPAGHAGIAKKMAAVMTDPALRKKLTNKGLARAREFTWDKTAEKFWDLIENTMNHA